MKRNFPEGLWCLASDFNVIKPKVVRKGQMRIINIGELDDFSKFIYDMDLVDIPMFGGKFTWVKTYGSEASIFDKILMFDSLVKV